LAGVFEGNRRRVLGVLEEEGFDVLVAVSKANITYLTGVREPAGAFVLSNRCEPVFLTPLLEYHRIRAQVPYRVVAFYRGGERGVEADVPRRDLVEGGLVEAIKSVLGWCSPEKPAADLGGLPYQLASSLAEAGLHDVSSVLEKVRSVKSNDEIALIENALRVSEAAFADLLGFLEEGVSEAEAAAAVYASLVGRGAWGEAFPTIVAFYDNTAFPHHTPTTLTLGVEGPVLVDWGAVNRGYRSDTTRTFWWGSNAPDNFQRLLETVLDAVNAAYDVLGPGVKAWEVDNAARTVLRKAGYSKYFIHGLGHGVGVNIHERPYLRPGSEEELEPGMVVTIEPGVYLPGVHGVRIEDLAVITPGGFRVLTRLPHLLP